MSRSDGPIGLGHRGASSLDRSRSHRHLGSLQNTVHMSPQMFPHGKWMSLSTEKQHRKAYLDSSTYSRTVYLHIHVFSTEHHGPSVFMPMMWHPPNCRSLFVSWLGWSWSQAFCVTGLVVPRNWTCRCWCLTVFSTKQSG